MIKAFSSCPRQELEPWKALEGLARESARTDIRALFSADPMRFERFSATACDVLLDYSKTSISAPVFSGLIALARACDFEKWRAAMYAGEAINGSEGRAVLHTALRSPQGVPVVTGGADVSPLIHETLARMKRFSDQVRTERRFTHIVNIGIGGSDLGPHMANQALRPFSDRELCMHYVSNADAAHLAEVLRVCEPERTLFIVTSKTFTTQETITNARSALEWMREKVGPEASCDHFAAVTQSTEKARELGISEDRIFPMWDWVGGRYSLWSAVGLALCISIGFENFRAMLDGAHNMDTHFLNAPLESNLPVLLALAGVWHRTFLRHGVLALLPYSQSLHKFPAFIQQLDMESNGKSVDRDGRVVPYPTGPIVFGEAGTNGQHAFHQLLHQGTTVTPCEFIAVAASEYSYPDHNRKLLSNVIGQTRALMEGKVDSDPQKRLTGNRPSVTIALKRLDPRGLGALVALYEHKVFTQGIIWNLNSFDQWGVELGKDVARNILRQIQSGELEDETSGLCDSSTAGLLRFLRHKDGSA